VGILICERAAGQVAQSYEYNGPHISALFCGFNVFMQATSAVRIRAPHFTSKDIDLKDVNVGTTIKM
jgi:hypothetical protein